MLTRRRAKQPEISLITGGDTLREVKTAVTTSVKTGRHQEVVVGQSLGAGSLVRVAIGKKIIVVNRSNSQRSFLCAA